MLPDQVSADPNIDSRTDIYGMGVMGYGLLKPGRPHSLPLSPRMAIYNMESMYG